MAAGEGCGDVGVSASPATPATPATPAAHATHAALARSDCEVSQVKLRLHGAPAKTLPQKVLVDCRTVTALQQEVDSLRARLYGRRARTPSPGRQVERCGKTACLEVKAQLKQEKAEHVKTQREFDNFRRTTLESLAAGEVRRFEAEAVELRQTLASERLHHRDVTCAKLREMQKHVVALGEERAAMESEKAELAERIAALQAAYNAEMAQQAAASRSQGKERAREKRAVATELAKGESKAEGREKVAEGRVAEAMATVMEAERRAAERIAAAEAQAQAAERECERQVREIEARLAELEHETERAKGEAVDARTTAMKAAEEQAAAMSQASDAERARMLMERQVQRAHDRKNELKEKVRARAPARISTPLHHRDRPRASVCALLPACTY